MGLEERQARPHRQGRCHQQARPESQGHRRLAKAPEAARTDPGILRRPPPALHHRITGTGRLTYALLGMFNPANVSPARTGAGAQIRAPRRSCKRGAERPRRTGTAWVAVRNAVLATPITGT